MFKAKKIIVILLAIILLLPCFIISISAETVDYSIPFSRPDSDFFSGFMEILFQNKTTGRKYVRVQSWSFSNINVSSNVDLQTLMVSANVTSSSITINYGFPSYKTDLYYSFDLDIAYITDTGTFDISTLRFSKDSGSSSIPSTSNSFWVPTEDKVVGVHIFGNGSFASNSSIKSGNSFNVVYGTDNTVINELRALKSILGSQAQDIINNQNQNTDEIKNNQDKNTQNVIDNQNQLQENEKNEAGSTGGGGVDDIGSIIPNDSEGFISSINNLVGVMSYNGTNCNWELPSVSLPKIDGVMPEIKLWDKLEIPFEYWIKQIPSSIMTLVQSLLTIALIVYCFKELYSIISYVLTLKGGGTGE